MNTVIANQIMGPVQHLTNKKKIIDNSIAATAAATNTIQPIYKSYTQEPKAPKSKLNKENRFTEVTESGMQK